MQPEIFNIYIAVLCILAERFTPGIGHVESCDELKREIIHQLCIRPMAHSELVKALPENVSKSVRNLSVSYCFSVSVCYILLQIFLYNVLDRLHKSVFPI